MLYILMTGSFYVTCLNVLVITLCKSKDTGEVPTKNFPRRDSILPSLGRPGDSKKLVLCATQPVVHFKSLSLYYEKRRHGHGLFNTCSLHNKGILKHSSPLNCKKNLQNLTAPIVHPATLYPAPSAHPATVRPAPSAHPATVHPAPSAHPATVYPTTCSPRTGIAEDTNGRTNTDNGQSPSASTSYTAVDRNRSIVARRSLRGLTAGNKTSNDDDDEDEDEYPADLVLKTKTACELDEIVYDDKTKRTKDQTVNNRQLTNSTQLDSTSQGDMAYQTITDLSILGGISQIWGIARNVSLFGISQLKSRTLDISECNLDISLSNVTLANFSPKATAQEFLEEQSTAQLIMDPSEQDNDTPDEEGYYTPSKDHFTPIARSPHGDTKTVLNLSRSKSRIRSRSRSESSSNGNIPYSRPSAILLRKRLLERIGAQGANETPIARRRISSESDTIADAVQLIESPKFNDSFACSQIRTEGYHKCGAGLIHLAEDLLSDVTQISKMDVVLAVQNIFGNEVNPLNYSASLYWADKQIFFSEGNAPMSDLTPGDPYLTLKDLLTLLNGHISEASDYTVRYNGLKITSTPDRCSRIPIPYNPDPSGGSYKPTAVLHLGKDRSLDMIPKKYHPDMTDVFDVQLGNFSVLTLLPDVQREMSIHLPQEERLKEPDGDHHIIITPFMQHIPDIRHVNLKLNVITRSPKTTEETINVVPCEDLQYIDCQSPSISQEEEVSPKSKDHVHVCDVSHCHDIKNIGSQTANPISENLEKTIALEVNDHEVGPSKNSIADSSRDNLDGSFSQSNTEDTLIANPIAGSNTTQQNEYKVTEAVPNPQAESSRLAQKANDQANEAIPSDEPREVESQDRDTGHESKNQSVGPATTQVAENVSHSEADDRLSPETVGCNPIGYNHFISSALCVDIVNCQNSDIIKEWLRKCKLISIGTGQSNRAHLLDEGIT